MVRTLRGLQKYLSRESELNIGRERGNLIILQAEKEQIATYFDIIDHYYTYNLSYKKVFEDRGLQFGMIFANEERYLRALMLKFDTEKQTVIINEYDLLQRINE